MDKATTFNLYRDIAERTEGDVYIGVVGPVRSGKSTFISRFMEQLVLPGLPDTPARERIEDELPQSGSGRSIMTTQPHFVPSEAVEVSLSENTPVRVRLVDSVGYLVQGAQGAADENGSRMVYTPWSADAMPFETAAEFGTRKVMTDHATIGLVITTDGSITDIPRGAYKDAENRVISEMKSLGKPFVVILNSASPRSKEALSLRDALEDQHHVPVMLMNVKDMEVSDIQRVLESVLLEFPLREVRLSVPDWIAALDTEHWLVQQVLSGMRSAAVGPHVMRESNLLDDAFADTEFTLPPQQMTVVPGEGRIDYVLPVRDGLFSQVLSEECGTEIRDDAHLLSLMKELVHAKSAYDKIADALKVVNATGYGIVAPVMDDLTLEEPSVIRQGGRYGVRITAHAPSLHLVRIDMVAEVTPVVGTQEQADDFVRQLQQQMQDDPQRVWETTFFGRTLESMVREGLNSKLMRIPADAQEKVKETLTRMVNEGDAGMICILL